jgi:hypothetical protein
MGDITEFPLPPCSSFSYSEDGSNTLILHDAYAPNYTASYSQKNVRSAVRIIFKGVGAADFSRDGGGLPEN